MADSKKVVEICTQYAQKGMFNIFLTVFFITLAFAFVESYFFIGYLVSIALFGLYQAVFMANAGGAWDNAKKIVETELKMKNTPLHAATVVGDTVGDPFKDTSSVALNPVIKFTTLFGLLAVELAVELGGGRRHWHHPSLAAVFLAIAMFFVYRSFYGMRIGGASSLTKATETRRTGDFDQGSRRMRSWKTRSYNPPAQPSDRGSGIREPTGNRVSKFALSDSTDSGVERFLQRRVSTGDTGPFPFVDTVIPGWHNLPLPSMGDSS